MPLHSVHRVEKTKTKGHQETGKQLLTSELPVLGAGCWPQHNFAHILLGGHLSLQCAYPDAERDVRAQAPSISFPKPPCTHRASTGRRPSMCEPLLAAVGATKTDPTDPASLHGLGTSMHAKYSSLKCSIYKKEIRSEGL